MMRGAIDDDYIQARRVLLDALDALSDHRDALILVGAQAVYLYTGETDIAVAPYTTDADLALDPALLEPTPELQETMQRAGFTLKSPNEPGIWLNVQTGFTVDLLVPDVVGGTGRRGARIAGHTHHAARKTRGLEGALVDKQAVVVEAFETDDARRYTINAAGPTALLIAKLHKIAERSADARRNLENKDALDVYRLLQAVATEDFADGFRLLFTDIRSEAVTREALAHLETLFGSTHGRGARMAAQALVPLADAETVIQSCAALAEDVIKQVQEAGLGTEVR